MPKQDVGDHQRRVVCCNVECLNFGTQNLRQSNVRVLFRRPSYDVPYSSGFRFHCRHCPCGASSADAAYCYECRSGAFVTPPPIRELSIVMSVSVCLCVCLSAIISSELPVRPSPNFLCKLPMAVAQSYPGGVVISYVGLLTVLWMTPYLLISQGCSTSPPS